METSLISGKTVNQIAHEQNGKLNHNDSSLIINNKSSKPRFETPDRTKEVYENLFLKRLAFLKKLLIDGNSVKENNNHFGLQNGNS